MHTIYQRANCYSIDGVIDTKTRLEAIDKKTGKLIDVYGLEQAGELPPEQSL